jgi:hypothetical protein
MKEQNKDTIWKSKSQAWDLVRLEELSLVKAWVFKMKKEKSLFQ